MTRKKVGEGTGGRGGAQGLRAKGGNEEEVN